MNFDAITVSTDRDKWGGVWCSTSLQAVSTKDVCTICHQNTAFKTFNLQIVPFAVLHGSKVRVSEERLPMVDKFANAWNASQNISTVEPIPFTVRSTLAKDLTKEM